MLGHKNLFTQILFEIRIITYLTLIVRKIDVRDILILPQYFFPNIVHESLSNIILMFTLHNRCNYLAEFLLITTNQTKKRKNLIKFVNEHWKSGKN